MSYTFFRFSSALVLSALAVQAQEPAPAPAAGGGQNPGQGAPGAGSSLPGAGQPGQGQPGQGNPRNVPTYPGQQQRNDPYSMPDRQQMMMFLSGKVIMDDGTPPPEPVLIERICTGVARPEGYTDSKGRFSFQLGQNNTMLADASTSGNDPVFGNSPGMPGRNQMGMGGSPTSRLMGCELRASLPGFQSQAVDLSNRRYMDNPDVGTIILRRLAKVEGFTFSATSAMAPKDARKAFEKGRQAIKKQKWEDAEKELQKAVDVYPKYAAAWTELGTVYQQQNKLDEAHKAYEQSIGADAKFVTPYAYLMRIAANQNKWEEAADYATKAIKLNPYLSADVYFIAGVANFQIKKFDDAEESTRAALKLDTQHRIPKLNHLLGAILAEKRDMPGAAQAMRDYLKLAPDAKDADNVKQQLAEIERNLGNREGAQPAQ